MSLSYSNNVIKSDYVKIKGVVSLSNFNSKNQEEVLVIKNETEEHENQRLELLKLEEEVNQKLAEAQRKYDEILNLARQESEKIIEQSNQKAIDIEKKAYPFCVPCSYPS